jgi:subtilase family serine protease
VVAVGGTTLNLNSDNSYNSETGWGYYSSTQGAFIGTGGGISQYETEPAYQQGVQSLGKRTTPDVSLFADPATGGWVADTYHQPFNKPFVTVGGTSLATPSWAGLLALVNQGRAAAGKPTPNSPSPTQTQQARYSLPQADYHVISSGTNGYSANPGYNLVTGLGTPVANLLVPDLIAYHGPGTTYSGPTIGPLQNATLTNTGSGSGGTSNVSRMSHFRGHNSLTAAGIGLDGAGIRASATSSARPRPWRRWREWPTGP